MCLTIIKGKPTGLNEQKMSIISSPKNVTRMDYFTYWNLCVLSVAFVIMLFVYIPIKTIFFNKLSERSHNIVTYVVAPVIITSVALCASVRFSVIDKVMIEAEECQLDSEKSKMLSWYARDYQLHMFPFIIGVILMISLFATTNCSPMQSLFMFILSCVYAIVLIVAWLIVPVKINTSQDEIVLKKKMESLYGKVSPVNLLFFSSAFFAVSSFMALIIIKT